MVIGASENHLVGSHFLPLSIGHLTHKVEMWSVQSLPSNCTEGVITRRFIQPAGLVGKGNNGAHVRSAGERDLHQLLTRSRFSDTQPINDGTRKFFCAAAPGCFVSRCRRDAPSRTLLIIDWIHSEEQAAQISHRPWFPSAVSTFVGWASSIISATFGSQTAMDSRACRGLDIIRCKHRICFRSDGEEFGFMEREIKIPQTHCGTQLWILSREKAFYFSSVTFLFSSRGWNIYFLTHTLF